MKHVAVAMFLALGCAVHGTDQEGGYLEPPSDMLARGDEGQLSEIQLPPVLEGSTRVPIGVEYWEDVSGAVNGPYLSYRLSDSKGLLFSADEQFLIGKTWTFADGGPLILRAEGVERKLVSGSMSLTQVGKQLRIDFTDLNFPGHDALIDGYVQGQPLERCRNLVDPGSGAAAAVGVDNRVTHLDETWSSAFCAAIPRAFN